MRFSEIDPLMVDVVLIGIILEDIQMYTPEKPTISDHLRDCFGWAKCW